jgi:plastocyanin
MIRANHSWLPSMLLAITLAACTSCSRNSGGATHGVLTDPAGGGGSLELDSSNLDTGATYQHRFTTAGTYRYYCIYHTPMTGSVVVSAAAADTLVSVNITSSSAPFPSASVRLGGRVVWTNNTSMVHTVTSY